MFTGAGLSGAALAGPCITITPDMPPVRSGIEHSVYHAQDGYQNEAAVFIGSHHLHEHPSSLQQVAPNDERNPPPVALHRLI